MSLDTEFKRKSDELIEKAAKNQAEFGSKALENGPKHVAIVADGNRRWAEQRDLSAREGHLEGAQNVIRLVERSNELGVEVLTLWLMDTKNFKMRSREEIRNLIKVFLYYLMKFKQEYLSENVRFKHIGSREFLPKKVQNLIRELETETAHKDQATLNIAFNYGGRDEIVRAVRRIVEDGIPHSEIDDKLISRYLDTHDIPDPDMIIRTGSEKRLSGFMSWQSAPAELFFSDSMFPDFTPDNLESMITQFTSRNRRFGA